MVRCSGVVIGQSDLLYDWLIYQHPVNDWLACLVFSCPMVGGSGIISNLQSIVVTQVFPENSIPLHLASLVTLFPVGIKVSCQDSATLPTDSPPVQLSCWTLSLSHLPVLLIANIVNPRYLFTCSPEVSCGNIICGPSAHQPPGHSPSLFLSKVLICFSLHMPNC